MDQNQQLRLLLLTLLSAHPLEHLPLLVHSYATRLLHQPTAPQVIHTAYTTHPCWNGCVKLLLLLPAACCCCPVSTLFF